MTPFQKYVKSIGPKAFAKEYGVGYRTALAYSGGERVPHATSEVAHRLIEQGIVTFQELYPRSS